MIVVPRGWAVLIANVLIPIAILIFSTGFFPYKPLLPGLASFEETGANNVPPRIFDKVIFMVIDALRSDFVYSNNSGFLFTQGLIRSGAALPFTAYASSPTVTMPRLKAMTTGSVPSFLDVILNIAESDTSSTLAYQDTWLAQLQAKGDQVVMYGDDTWLKLFPGMFGRADGTTSFFVSDFTEVDNNVTRHVPSELLQDDWSALILHYLGLDHIGHKSGPKSPYMMTKQQEMDSIVSQIYKALEQEEHLESTLFVLCGDHGMNDAGNHGGSSVGETSPALLFVSPKFQALGINNESPVEASSDLQYYRLVEQTDITPTLAGLLGLPIPLNSLGTFIPEFLAMWDNSPQRVHMLFENSKQLLKTVKEAFPNYDFDSSLVPSSCDLKPSTGIEEVRCAWFRVSEILRRPGAQAGNGTEAALLEFLKAAQDLMSGAASNYDLKSLYLGICVASLAVWLCFYATHGLLFRYSRSGTFLVFSILGYGSMMFASSYVEEEQQYWYWLLTGWTVYLHIKLSNSLSRGHRHDGYHQSIAPLLTIFGAIGLAICHRILRRWNQTGQKFAAEPDIARSFFPFHQHALWALVILTYSLTSVRLMYNLPRSIPWRFLVLGTTATAFFFKLVFVASDSPELLSDSHLAIVTDLVDKVSLVLHARLTFCGILLLLMAPVYFIKHSRTPKMKKASLRPIFHEALTLLLITQSRVTNIPAFLVFKLQHSVFASMEMTAVESSITSILLQYMSFFAFGGSNAISSVDLSNAYNGINIYSVVFVGILTFMSNWAGPIWWVSASRLLRYKQSREDKQTHITILTFHAAMTLFSVMLACTALRTHLFIWTVFSPKYLYTVAWVIVNHLAVNLLGEADVSFVGMR